MFPNYPVLRVLETQLTFMAVGEPDYTTAAPLLTISSMTNLEKKREVKVTQVLLFNTCNLHSRRYKVAEHVEELGVVSEN